MKHAVAELYSYLNEFLLWAHDWYEENAFVHVLHSIKRTAELRYEDLLLQIADCSRNIDRLAMSGAQAEQRDMHKKLESVVTKLEQTPYS